MGGITKAARFAKRECLEILPVAIFFLVSFNLITFSKHLILADKGIIYQGFTAATIGALLVAKVVLVADLLPLMRRYRGRPLYRPIFYRTVIYTLFVFLAQLLESVVRNMIQAGSFSAAFKAAGEEFIWAHLIFVQMWVFVLFLVYVTLVELREEFGGVPLAKVLFSREEKSNSE